MSHFNNDGSFNRGSQGSGYQPRSQHPIDLDYNRTYDYVDERAPSVSRPPRAGSSAGSFARYIGDWTVLILGLRIGSSIAGAIIGVFTIVVGGLLGISIVVLYSLGNLIWPILLLAALLVGYWARKRRLASR